jgi:hypothetical protein
MNYARWTEEEQNIIKKYAGQMTDEQLVRVLQAGGRNTTLVAVRRKRVRLGIKKKGGRGRFAL